LFEIWDSKLMNATVEDRWGRLQYFRLASDMVGTKREVSPNVGAMERRSGKVDVECI
jgi:hypothetical protein